MADRHLFDGAALRATLAEASDAKGAPASKLMVTFDFRKIGKNDFDPPVKSSNFAKAGFSQLSIRTRRNDWFINDDTAALISALPAIVAGFDEVRCLGYSMGGYGAFRFARALNATSVVAISPQISIDPRIVPFDRRYRPESAGFDPTLGDMIDQANPDLQGAVLFDPFVRADLRHARMLQTLFPKLHLGRLGFGGHPAIRLLRPAKKSWTVFKIAAAEVPHPGIVINAHRGARRSAPIYWKRLANRAEAKRPGLAATARDKAEQLEAKAGQ